MAFKIGDQYNVVGNGTISVEKCRRLLYKTFFKTGLKRLLNVNCFSLEESDGHSPTVSTILRAVNILNSMWQLRNHASLHFNFFVRTFSGLHFLSIVRDLVGGLPWYRTCKESILNVVIRSSPRKFERKKRRFFLSNFLGSFSSAELNITHSFDKLKIFGRHFRQDVTRRRVTFADTITTARLGLGFLYHSNDFDQRLHT